MATLLDTNILVRLANKSDRKHATALGAIARLHACAEALAITSQIIIEFRAVATRPTSANGLGFSLPDTKSEIDGFLASFPLLPETPAIFPAWLDIVDGLGGIGKQVHDARLAACCHVHGIGAILTFNVPHFARFSTFGPGLRVLDPATV